MLEAYLDIETTGLSPTYDAITVIGIYLTDGSAHRIVQLMGEEDLPDNGELSGAAICDMARSAIAAATGDEKWPLS